MRPNRLVLFLMLGFMLALTSTPTGGQGQPAPTFTKDVAPILFKNCSSCHRTGEIGPMPLLTYENARPYARAIAQAVESRKMPPWHADAPAGTFHDERRLTDAERETLVKWAGAGAPRGNSEDLPPAPVFTDGWSLGEPDVVLQMDEDFPVPAAGSVEYMKFYIPANFTEAKWVKSIEVRPGNRAVVHHVLVRYRAKPDMRPIPLARPNMKDIGPDPPERVSIRPERKDFAVLPRTLLATYAPGTNPQVAPPGTAFRLAPGGIFEIEVHYTTNGRETTDRTRLGITFSKDKEPREVRAQDFLNRTFTIPAGASNVAVTTDLEFVQDAVVWGLFPHTHLRGKKWTYTLQLPSGESRTILSVPTYDFNWQTYYIFNEPLQVPKGSKIIATAWYDNSRANKSNPDATRAVTWGDQTWEEMQYSGVLLSAGR